MRYILPLIVAAFLALGFTNQQADAGYSRCNCPRCQQVRRQQQPNFFQKMMELERKKNAWLRRTFLGK